MMFRGSIVALVTPFTRALEVDFEAYGRLIDFHLDQGTHGLVPCGCTGEAATLSHDEQEACIRFAVERAAGRIPVIAGTGSNNTQEAIRLTQYAKEVGADGALLITPYYNKPTVAGQIAHYTAVAEAADIPIVLYNVPGRTGTKMLPELQAFIADGGMAIGICNGFQVLVKTGLLPGGGGQTVTLAHNNSHRYEDSWVDLEVVTDRCAWTRKGEKYFVPIAHAEGKLVASDATLDALEENGQVVFRYVGRNPNGSHRDIAGICDETGRVLGLMPHPERHIEPWQHPYWTAAGLATQADGLRLFENAIGAS